MAKSWLFARTSKQFGTGKLIFRVHIDVTITRKVESQVMSVNDVLINLRHLNVFFSGFGGFFLRGGRVGFGVGGDGIIGVV